MDDEQTPKWKRKPKSGLNSCYGHFGWCLLILDDSDSLVHHDRLFMSWEKKKRSASQVNNGKGFLRMGTSSKECMRSDFSMLIRYIKKSREILKDHRWHLLVVEEAT
jgi:hypothetical protein